MSLDYISKHYQVPAKVGARVTIRQNSGVIVGSSGPYILVRLDGEIDARIYHPTDDVVYEEQP